MDRRTDQRAWAVLAVAAAVLFAPVVSSLTAGAAGTMVGPATITPASGDGSTGFTLTLPEGAACEGDSANDGWRVASYMVPIDVDPAGLQFSPTTGPNPNGLGEAFRQPLYEAVTTTPLVQGQTAAATNPGGPGPIVNVPTFDFEVYSPGHIPPGSYHVGIACILGPAGPDQLDRFWDETITVTQDPEGGAAQVAWVRGVPTTTTSSSSTSSSTTSTTQPSSTTSTSSTTTSSTTTVPSSTTSTSSTTTSSTTTSSTTTSSTTTVPSSTTSTSSTTTSTSSTTTTVPSSTTSTTVGSTSTTLPPGTTIDDSSVPPGGSVTVSSTGWAPGSTVAVTLRSDPVSLAPLTADATGRVVGAIAIPPGTALGDHTLQLSGRDTAGAVRTVTIGVTVTAQGSSTSTTAARALPRTGSSTGDRALAAAALIGVGMVLLGNGMGRRASRSSAR